MIIHPKGSRPSEPGPEDYFTGEVEMAPLISAPAPARLRGVTVTFQPGARTAWHVHRCKRLTKAMSSGSAPERNTGTAPRQTAP